MITGSTPVDLSFKAKDSAELSDIRYTDFIQ